MEDKPQIFLSYASEDRRKVKSLCRKLEKIGFHVWIDREEHQSDSRQKRNNIGGGHKWLIAIGNAILESDLFLACASKTYITKKSPTIRKELKLALQLCEHKAPLITFLIPIRLEACDLPPKLQPYQAFDFYKKEGFERLKRTLLTWLEKRKAAKQAPDSSPITIPAELVLFKHTECRVHLNAQLHPDNEITELNQEKVIELERMLGFALPITDNLTRGKGTEEVWHEVEYRPIGLLFSGKHLFSNKGGLRAYSPWPFKDVDVRIGRDLLDQMILTLHEGAITVTPKES